MRYALLAAGSIGLALDGQTGIHDPSTIAICNGKFYTYGTGGNSLVSDDSWTWRRGTPLQIPGPKEILPMIESEHDNLTPQKGRACPARTRELLDTLVKGGEFHPGGSNQ